MKTDTTAPVLEHVIGADGLFVLRIEDGDVRLLGTDGDRVTVRSDDGGSLIGFDVERGDRSLELRAHHGFEPRSRGRARRDSVDLDIAIPAGASVILEARNADVVCDGLAGDARLTTASGDLTIHGAAGTLAAETVSGDLEIVADGALALTARTVSGDLEIRARSLSTLKATTTSGDLTIAGSFAGEGPYTIDTVSGDTSLAPDGDVLIEVTTLTGDIYGRGIGHRVSGDRGPIVIGSGAGPTITFRSTSGDLSVDPRSALDRPDSSLIAPASPAYDGTDAAPEPDPALEILRALERGDIDVDEATRRLAALDVTEGGGDA